MKKLQKLKLTSLDRNRLQTREMNRLTGGAGDCGCACAYAEQGGSSTRDNREANNEYDKQSPGYTDECSPCSSNGQTADSAFWQGEDYDG